MPSPFREKLSAKLTETRGHSGYQPKNSLRIAKGLLQNHHFATALSLSKNYASRKNNRVAGELEGARPASNWIKRRRKALNVKGFRAKQHFEEFKMLGGLSLSKKVLWNFFDKLRAVAKPSFCNSPESVKKLYFKKE